jgi:hypothetical protein
MNEILKQITGIVGEQPDFRTSRSKMCVSKRH